MLTYRLHWRRPESTSHRKWEIGLKPCWAVVLRLARFRPQPACRLVCALLVLFLVIRSPSRRPPCWSSWASSSRRQAQHVEFIESVHSARTATCSGRQLGPATKALAFSFRHPVLSFFPSSFFSFRIIACLMLLSIFLLSSPSLSGLSLLHHSSYSGSRTLVRVPDLLFVLVGGAFPSQYTSGRLLPSCGYLRALAS